jgi:hypothetical protein
MGRRAERLGEEHAARGVSDWYAAAGDYGPVDGHGDPPAAVRSGSAGPITDLATDWALYQGP